MYFSEKNIPYGLQFRNDKCGIIVNWYPKKGTVFIQKNQSELDFPNIARKKEDVTKIFLSQKKNISFNKPEKGICVDAGTKGNPGPSEYQICRLDGTLLEHAELGLHTNNYAELYGVWMAIVYAQKHNIQPVWTDSQVTLSWITSKKVGKTVKERDKVVAIIEHINTFLLKTPIPLKKWHTERWGEIPADFGRKK